MLNGKGFLICLLLIKAVVLLIWYFEEEIRLLDAVLSVITLKEVALILIAAWLIFAITKRLLKLALLAGVVFALVYFVYPLVAPVINSR
jgi:hypothetical protein